MTTPKLNPQIFREYDIRGIVGEDLTAATVEQIGLAAAAAKLWRWGATCAQAPTSSATC